MGTATSFDELAQALQAAYAGLSPQQRLIAQFVLEHPDDIALGTAATVAEAAGVQPSALVRFANVMGYSGFSELQQVFRRRLLVQAGTYRQRIGAMHTGRNGSAPVLLAALVEAGVADLRQVERSVSDAELRRAARALCAAGRVHVLAQRRAFPVAAYLAYALGQLELRVQLHDGVGGMLGDSLRPVGRGEALLVTSFRNYSPEVVDAAAAAKARGARIVAITDLPLSPLRPVADICLEIGGSGPAPVRSLVAAMCLAQALVVSAGQCLVEPARKRKGAAGANGDGDASAGSGRRTGAG
jgi:DNA-binding MurR/RpiR family transcriptional regulator